MENLNYFVSFNFISSDIDIALIYTILPFCVFVAPPIVGFLGDKLGNYVRYRTRVLRRYTRNYVRYRTRVPRRYTRNYVR